MADYPNSHRQPVFVLGASGFIGSALVSALARSPRWQPVPVSRRQGGPGSITADATDPASMRTILSEGVTVVNCIAGSNRTMQHATDVLCSVARQLPPRRIIHLSSMAVYGSATGTVRENTAPVPPLSAYGRAKCDAERTILRYVDGGGDAAILRPSCVFGPGSVQWTTRIARLLTSHRLGDLGSAGDGGCNLVFIDDLIETIIHALEAPSIGGRTFNVSNPDIPSWNDFLIRFGIALGATPIRRIPERALRIETKWLAPLRRIAGKRLKHPATEAITPSLAALFAQDIQIDSSAAATVLAMPATPIARMIETALRRPVPDPERVPLQQKVNA